MSATTTPAASSVLATQTGVTEVSGGGAWGYVRQAHPASAWGAQGGATIWGQVNARRVVGAQLSFAAATAAYAVPINGFFMAATSSLSTGPALFYSNFDDTTAIASLSLGDIIKVTPTWGLLG